MNHPTLEKLSFKINKKKNCYAVKAASTDIVGEIVIPNVYRGIQVSVIDDYAFFCCSKVKSVSIPDSILSIGDSAFCECSSLMSIAIPNAVVSIGCSAFSKCSSLTSIIIPKNVVSIESNTFFDCSSLKEVILVNGLKTIKDYAFNGCSSLKEIAIPDSVESLGKGVFSRCSSLKNIGVKEQNLHYSSIDGVLFNKNHKVLLQFPCAHAKSYTIPVNTVEIGENAFSDCSSLLSINIGINTVLIGDYAFSWCKKLKTVTIKSEDVVIADGAFCNCESLESILIPNKVKSIGYNALGGCPLKSITIPYVGDTTLKRNFFRKIFGSSISYDPKEHCSYSSDGIPPSLTTIFIGNGYTSIENEAFMELPYRSSISLFIPSSVISIGEEALNSSPSIKSVIVDSNNPVYSFVNGALFKK